ncbi:glycosyltransferase [Pseudocnuella soli]|uniref:glycosyltransferase n=1 Tax=Pseudocnuella soli TaxID=2502779 RepID=UPI001405489D|nr:glycosyltransferase [Pseudocnuella soli]
METVLYLSYTGMTDPLGQSQVLSYLSALSQNAGYRFVIVSFEKPEVYNRLKDTIEEACAKAGIEWHPLSYTSKPPVVSTFRDVRRMRSKAIELMERHRFSLVHCRSYIPSLTGLYLKRNFGIPFLFDMRGFWADERLDGNIWHLSNPVYRIIYQYFKKKEKQFLLNANHIVSLTRNARDVIGSWKLDLSPLPITVIPCCVDMSLFQPQNVSADKQSQVRQALGIPQEANVISYVGSLGTWYMLPEMMAFVKQYFDAFPGSYFMILTGEPEQMVHDTAQQYGVDIQRIKIKKVPRAEMPIYISLSTLSIFFIKPAFSKKASSPVKQGELMAMGIPIVCNDSVGDTGEIIEAYKAGIVLDSFTPQAYAQAIAQLKERQFDKHQIILGAQQEYSLEHGVNSYASVYQKILND